MTEPLLNSSTLSEFQPEYLSVAEVAQILRVSASTVRTWVTTKRLRAHRYEGRLIRIRRSDLEIFIERSRTGESPA